MRSCEKGRFGRERPYLVSDGMWELAVEVGLYFGGREMETVAIVGGSAVELSLFPDGIESFGRTEAAIRFVGLQ